ncbi:glycosyltransferase family 2 protein [Ruegeria pomeroyi]|nr:glycosyltransferase family 2 protein [Ruegeria pomeroyi]
MNTSPTWGVVATVKAPEREILRFSAWHLEQGAHRLFLYLDDPDPAVFSRLKAHPRIRVFACDESYWQRRKLTRPVKHQARQTMNARHAYNRADVDWLAHVDVDEFIWSETPIATILSTLPDDTLCARMRPIEALAGDDALYKAFIPGGPARDGIVRRLYPTFGAFVKGGFMSHVAGKVFARTGMEKVDFRIHNIFRNKEMNPHQVELDTVDLCHRHGADWDHWIAAYRYRIAKGSYRPDLAPNVPREAGGLSMHELLSGIEEEEGEAGLRAFFDELNATTPEGRARLRAAGMLKHRPLDLDGALLKQFPL